MALSQIDRVHGTASAGAFYGIQPLCIKVTDSSSNFTADSGGGTSAIVEGGYTKMVRAIQTLGSVVILGTQANGAFCAVVDGASFNAGGDATNTGWGGILKTLATAVANDIGTAGTIAITSGTVFTSAGVFTLA
jgi:hypothetical protein